MTPAEVMVGNVYPVINDADQRDALPDRTVVLSADNGWVHVFEKWPNNAGWYGLGYIDEPHTPPLPITVLYIPEDRP